MRRHIRMKDLRAFLKAVCVYQSHSNIIFKSLDGVLINPSAVSCKITVDSHCNIFIENMYK